MLVFGSLTLVLHNDEFIKLKPTIIYVLFGGALLGGLVFGKPLLGMLFDQMFELTDEGWRKLTWRWTFFFFALAVLNEIVWRNFYDRFLGQLQVVRRGAADVFVRRAAISADLEVQQRQAKLKRRRRPRPRRAIVYCASALSISGISVTLRFSAVIGPTSL